MTTVEQAHHPALAHQFDDIEQQRAASNFGMWVFLITEIMFFGGLFTAYLVYRNWYFPEFGAGSSTLDIKLGATNTAVLLCSSLTMALAVRSAQTGARRLLMIFLGLTLALGLVFLGIKAVEYRQKFAEHHVPGASFCSGEKLKECQKAKIDPIRGQIFFSLYFAMTGMHALHMVIGAGLLSFLLLRAWQGAYGADYYTPVDNIGLYWHFVDIVWIYLFPLLYLINRIRASSF